MLAVRRTSRTRKAENGRKAAHFLGQFVWFLSGLLTALYYLGLPTHISDYVRLLAHVSHHLPR